MSKPLPDRNERPITLPQLAERVGMEYRTAHLWVREGLIVPSYASDGTGHPNLFSEADVERAGRLVRLREAGLSVDGLRRVVEGSPEPLREALAVWEEGREGRTGELEAAALTLREALIQSNLTSKTRAEQGRIAQEALNATWDVLKEEGRVV